jgi:hypothetical protein
MVVWLHYLGRRFMLVTFTKGLDLQPLEKSVLRRGNMHKTIVDMSLIDSQFAGRLAMGLWRPVDTRYSWRRLVS